MLEFKGQQASKIPFATLRYFDQSEFPNGVLDSMTAGIVLEQNKLRERMPDDYVMTPSPVTRAHVRIGKKGDISRHSLQGGIRLSDATDTFMHDWYQALQVWREAKSLDFGGIGIYFTRWIYTPDNIQPMFHFDMRPNRLRWVCVGDKYYYDKNILLIIDRLAEGVK